MSTMRYSGQLTIRVTYLEPYLAGDVPPAGRSTRLNGEYRCFIRSRADDHVTVYVGAPAQSIHSVDSPEAFDDAARVAIIFADAESDENGIRWGELAAYGVDGSGYHVGRGRSRAWPTAPVDGRATSPESNDGA